ncbi:MAG TPA: diguanylate cyclase [Candidatus Dormibacteraeota bacterium]|nr:diguanylate cyclase [Candidatus Dormibacteraeota bacterium]
MTTSADPSAAQRASGGAAILDDPTIGDIPDAVFATDVENRITHWAPSAEALFGYTAAEAVGRPFGELIPYRMRNTADEQAFFLTIAAGRTWRGQGTVRLRDGSEAWIESVVKPRIVDGRVVGSVSVSRDVTASIEAERFVIGQERFLDAVLHVAGSPVLVLDPAGSVVRFNAACELLSGYRASEILGRRLVDVLIPPDERADAARELAEATTTGAAGTHEHRWIARDGMTRRVLWSNTCLTDESGAVTHVIATGVDVTEQRRADAALRGIELVGNVLARLGPTPEALDDVVRTLAEQMAYTHIVLLLAEADGLRVGAQRGYDHLGPTLSPDERVVGRVYRSGKPEWIRDVNRDPDYRPDDPAAASEIAVPILAGDRVVGVLAIEGSVSAPIAEHDFRLAQAVGDRIGSALLLAHEQQALAERARLLAGLNDFARTATPILEPARLWQALLDGISPLFPGDVTTLTVLDRASGRYHLRAANGVPASAIGVEVRPGDGPAGRAIRSRAFLGPVELHRDGYASFLRDSILPDALVSVAAPLIRDDVVLGAISIGRADLDQPFSEVECELLELLAAQTALVLGNAFLHEEVSELAIHDGLTGLYNRRHFDATLDLILARWRRMGGSSPISAIMFDLDHFGRFNRDHGHLAGDATLRAFAGLLHERLRSSDLVARYGGEEFVVILEDCRLEDAVRLADEIRSGLDAAVVAGPHGQALRATVSGGCAQLDPADATKESLLRAADVGLFMAKRAGRNQIVAA